MSTPSDEARRQSQVKESGSIIDTDIFEDLVPEPGSPEPVHYSVPGETASAIHKFKLALAGAYAYLTITSAIVLGAIVLNTSEEVRNVALAVWASTAALGGALLRWTYRKL